MQLTRIGIWPSLGRPVWLVAPGPSFRIGRGPDCEVRLEDPAVSAFHAEVTDNGSYISDLASRNGTWLNGQSISGVPYRMGQNITIGGFTLRMDPVTVDQAPPQEIEQLLERLYHIEDPRHLDIARDWVRVAPGESRALRSLARGFLKAGDLNGAAVAAARAAMGSPDNPQTLVLQGLVAERQGDLERAEDFLNAALDADPRMVEAARVLSRVAQKQDVFAKVHQLVDVSGKGAPAASGGEAFLESGPFRIHFKPDRHGSLVLLSHGALAQAADKLEELLGFAPEGVEVRLGEDTGGDWKAALYDGAICIRAGRAAADDPNFFYVVLAHEYVHLVVDRLSGGTAPAWLSEGLAQFVTQNQTPADRRILETARREEALLPIEILENDFEVLEEPALVNLAYAQSYSIIQLLVEEWGWGGVRDLLMRLGEGRGIDHALAPWGVDLWELEVMWQAWLS